MSSIAARTRQHRLAVFFVLSLVVSWWAWPAYLLGWSPTPFFACGPLVAALVVVGVTEGRAGYRTLGARLIRWRVGWIWWVVALGTPLAVLAVATVANVTVWGAPAPVLARMAWGALAANFAIRFVNPLDGPLGEEPGFRGYALPWLQVGRSPLAAGLMLAAFVTLWHLPIVTSGALPPFALVVTFAITLVYVWLFDHTDGSVLLTLVFHVAQGTVGYAALGFAGADADRMDWLAGALWIAIAIAVVVFDRRAWRIAPAAAVAGRSGEPAPVR